MPPQRKPQDGDEQDRRDFDPRSSNHALFAHKLRTYREREGMSQTEVGAFCNVSNKMISAIENLYRIPNDHVAKRLDILFDTDVFEDQYWLILRDAELTPGFLSYTRQESKADSIRMFAPMLIPGLLQTESYARAVLSTWEKEDKVEQMLAVRLARQGILEREDPPHVAVLIKEAVLREPVGGREVHREQLDHLLDLARRPNIAIQVIPTGAAAYDCPFVLFGYSDEADLGYVEGAIDLGHMVEPPRLVFKLALRFDQFRGEALTVSESEELIRSIREAS
ncbi:helix-turn-helix domain-containing protein [Actinomadura rupiterrae]|uniref:helix-turn-helix domain-containing protein n=1 Tax=Actinomadura rupiterrae TaxID=559627 RepID=UPI0020A46DCB|nr:helix-turn-helix transcriptional regulator [Actinomadura rupiterrae]MCP2335125.1 transcriptional regulator with XRE-family HTH domain [Actinomadura rupiterrae]